MAINNTASPDLSPCHRDFLQSLQIQANIIVPMKMGRQLWGLIVAHECFAPRNWQDKEMHILQQVANEAVLAIEQAKLYESSQAIASTATEQVIQLTQAIKEIQQAQAQLLKNEKISTLRLWAVGVAQEMKIPVNFIYRNLSYSSEYIQQLLELLRLYQSCYPYPNIEVRDQAEAMDLDLIMQNLPQIMLAMKVQAERMNSIMLSLRNFSGPDQSAIQPDQQPQIS